MSTDRRFVAFLALIVCAWALAVYLATLAPTVTLVDSGELISAAWFLDVAHPPGMPLYVLVGYLFSKLPAGTPALRLNLMSAVFGALTAGVVLLLCLVALRLPERRRLERKRDKPARGKPQPEVVPAHQVLASLLAGLTFATAATLWAYSTVAEVYTLNTFLLATTMLFFLLALGAKQPEAGRRYLPLAFLFFGLALAVHHVSAFLLIPAGLYLLWLGRLELRGVLSWRSLAFVLPGLATYLYLPLRAVQQPLLNWGNPSSLERFYWHVTGKQYRSNLTADWPTFFSRLWFFSKLWANELTVVGFAVVLLGFWIMFKRQRRLFTAAALTVGVNLVYALLYDISEDNEAYALPTFLLFGIGLAWGIRYLVERTRPHRKLFVAFCAALALLPVLSLLLHYKENNHREYRLAEDYARDVLDNTEPEAVVLTMDWQLYSPLLYVQNVRNQRPDATTIDVNLLRRSWYLDYLNRRYPAMMGGVRDEADIYLSQLSLFEHGQPYDPAVIQQAFVGFINAIVDTSFRSRPVYLTVDVSEQPGIAERYFRAPIGPIFRLFTERPERLTPEGTWRTGGFTNPDLHLDTVMRRVRSNYALMHINRGIYLTLYERPSEAVEWYRRGLALDPEISAGHLMLARSYTALGRKQEARRCYERLLELQPDSPEAKAELMQLE